MSKLWFGNTANFVNLYVFWQDGRLSFNFLLESDSSSFVWIRGMDFKAEALDVTRHCLRLSYEEYFLCLICSLKRNTQTL